MLMLLEGATEPVAVALKRSTTPPPFEAYSSPVVVAERLLTVVSPVVALKGIDRVGWALFCEPAGNSTSDVPVVPWVAAV
jgi:hypothetical protein